jgi:predicted acetyltransferase
MSLHSRTVLHVPTLQRLPAYVDALRRRWSPNTMRPEAADEQLAQIEQDAAAFVDALTDLDARAGPVTLPDGSKVDRLPGRSLWVWDVADDAFCGAINLRWQRGTAELPPHVLGHLGYSIVPWRQRCGHATAALRALLPIAREHGLPHVEITTDDDNLASQRVIEANGGVRVTHFAPPPAFGTRMLLRYRIALV